MVIVADLNGEWCSQRILTLWLLGRKRLKVDELRFLSVISSEGNAGNLVEEGPVFQFLEPMLLGS